jgi:hypothetical protein
MTSHDPHGRTHPLVVFFFFFFFTFCFEICFLFYLFQAEGGEAGEGKEDGAEINHFLSLTLRSPARWSVCRGLVRC